MENLTHIAYHEILFRITYNEDRPYASPVISFIHITLSRAHTLIRVRIQSAIYAFPR